MQEKHDQWSWQWDRFHDDSKWLFEDWIYPNKLEDFRGKTILDCGCGGGNHINFVAPFASRIVGVDLNAISSSSANTKNLKNVELREADIAEMDLGEKFDIIYCIGVLHHTDNPKKSFENISRHAKSGGRVIIWVYSKEGNFLNRTLLEWFKRIILLRLPRGVSWVIGYILTALLYIPIYTIYILPFGFLPFYEYFQNWRKLSFQRNFLNVFDKLNAPQTWFLSRQEIEGLFNPNTFGNVHISPYKGVSWRASGMKK